ncbi:MAG: hypothetical protein WBN83_03745, partial [Desulfoprunum sp.]|uniref:hypothetical protein n=1 Tax=Desulfoprunum sp. TaxID=2020866 RepID=UPI003C7469A5
GELFNLNCYDRVVNIKTHPPILFPPPGNQPPFLHDPSSKDRGKLLYLLAPVKIVFQERWEEDGKNEGDKREISSVIPT